MARPINTTPLPPHPAIDPAYQLVRKYGRIAYSAKVTCPGCKAERWYPLSVLRQQMKRFNFNGQCRACGKKDSAAGYYQWAKKNGVARRSVSHNGYVVLGPTAIPPEDLPLFRAMQNKNFAVSEHRFVMAKALGRPLKSYEHVDHQDGEKTNNALGNLRIYLRGKQQPGSCPGYGTYYHEWQLAEAKIRTLEARLKELED